jgi:Zn-dependent protease with chaperone function/type II secretory pathway pseudopilin PulG
LKDLVFPRERILSPITLLLGLLFWFSPLIVAALMFGPAKVAGLAIGMSQLAGPVTTSLSIVIALLILFGLYAFAQSALITYVKGEGVRLTPEQFPQLYATFRSCCEKLGIQREPEAYVLQGDGMLNAFAARFLGKHFVVLLSSTIDAMEKHPDGVAFYMGHELGHVRRGHLLGHLWRWPCLWLPLLGAAYSRAQESTCDRHGLACSSSPENAARAMLAMAAGQKQWQSVSLPQFQQQTGITGRFWMAYHELTSTYPWLTKRVARVLDPKAKLPWRNPLAYFFALFVPNVGRFSGAAGPWFGLTIAGLIMATGISAYQAHQAKLREQQMRAEVAQVYQAALAARDKLTARYMTDGEVPDTLQAAGVSPQLPLGASLSMDEYMVLTVKTTHGLITLTPSADNDNAITWECAPGADFDDALAPEDCKPEKPDLSEWLKNMK